MKGVIPSRIGSKASLPATAAVFIALAMPATADASAEPDEALPQLARGTRP